MPAPGAVPAAPTPPPKKTLPPKNGGGGGAKNARRGSVRGQIPQGKGGEAEPVSAAKQARRPSVAAAGRGGTGSTPAPKTAAARVPEWNSPAKTPPSPSGEASPESRASKDAKRRLSAFTQRQQALAQRRLKGPGMSDEELLRGCVPAPQDSSTLMLHLSPANYSALTAECFKPSMGVRAPSGSPQAPPPTWARPESLISYGEASHRTKAREHQDFFHSQGRRATPFEAQIAATRQGGDPTPVSPKCLGLATAHSQASDTNTDVDFTA